MSMMLLKLLQISSYKCCQMKRTNLLFTFILNLVENFTCIAYANFLPCNVGETCSNENVMCIRYVHLNFF